MKKRLSKLKWNQAGATETNETIQWRPFWSSTEARQTMELKQASADAAARFGTKIKAGTF